MVDVRADAQHDVLRHSVFLREVVEVVRGNSLQAQLVCQLGKLAVHFILGHTGIGGNALVLQFDVEVARLIERSELLSPFLGFRHRSIVNTARNDACDASAGGNNALGILFQHFKRGAGAVIEVVNMRFAYQFQQVVIARVVLGKQNHVMKLLFLLLQFAVGGEVNLASENGLYPFTGFLFHLAACFIKLGNTRHNTVIGDCHGWHIQIGSALNHVVDMGSTIEQGILSVAV